MVVYFGDGTVDERPVGFVPCNDDGFRQVVYVVDFDESNRGHLGRIVPMRRVSGEYGAHGGIVGYEADASQELMDKARETYVVGRQPKVTQDPWTGRRVMPWEILQEGDVVEVTNERYGSYAKGTLIEVASYEVVWRRSGKGNPYNFVVIHGTNGERVNAENCITLVSSPFRFQDVFPAVEA